jgi:hypothetical protein
MARAGMDPAVAAERAGHSDGGALFLQRYRHLYEAEKREQALRLEGFIRMSLDGSWTADAAGAEIPLNQPMMLMMGAAGIEPATPRV